MTSVTEAVVCPNRVNTLLCKGMGVDVYCVHDSAECAGDFVLRTLQLGTIFNPLKPSGHYMYHQFNIQQLYVLPTQAVFMYFVWI